MDFAVFKNAVAKKFSEMKGNPLFRTSALKDDMWNTYLGSFPAGSNPIFRERAEHDCNCCKNFIRTVGNVVAIENGKLVSIWDVAMPDEPEYQAVANELAKLVKANPIANVFVHDQKTAGTDKTFEQMVDHAHTWEHFFVNIPARFVKHGSDIPSFLGGVRSTHDVLLRALRQITDDAVDTTLELISQGSLYRGDEHRYVVSEFKKLKQVAAGMPDDELDMFVWLSLDTVPPSVAGIRNAVIGTLLVDLSEGKELEECVKAFEVKVAPTNYKRPTALITQKMIDQAKEKLAELGLTSALERRYATPSDLTVNNILFADRNTKKVMGEDVFGSLKPTKKPAIKSLDRIDEVPIEKFISDILPSAESIELLFENRHTSNLVSLIAPADPTAGALFKWPNRFSWTYNGEVADSIKERVKKAGGKVEGDLCCRLAWNNTDDLDFHMVEPNGYRINYTNRRRTSPAGGVLDLDANGADGMRTDPAENIVYVDKRNMRSGKYRLMVHQFSLRNRTNPGFEVEVEVAGQKWNMVYEKLVRQGGTVQVADINYDQKTGEISVTPLLPSHQSSQNMWGLCTQDYHKVNMVMLSPNYWDGHGVGNKHYFFMLEGCRADGQARGFYNEFLKEDLTPHRKVFEVVGSKMRVPESDNQLSGLGFSSTQQNSVLCRVSGSFSRVIKITF